MSAACTLRSQPCYTNIAQANFRVSVADCQIARMDERLRWTKFSALLLARVALEFGAALTAQAQSVTRGPYLQNGSTTAISIRWRTNTATDSVVRYGTSPSSLTQSVSNASSVTEHELRLTGLAQNTQY